MEGKWVKLRSWEKSDIPTYAEWIRNVDVSSLTHITRRPTSLREIEEEFESYFSGKWNVFHCAIIDKMNGELLGKFHWEECLKGPNVYEVGIVIGKSEYWSRGIGLEACYLGAKILFEELMAHKIMFLCAEYNQNIVKFGKRLGFKEEGRIRDRFYSGGRYVDGIWMGLMREEYKQRTEQYAHLVEAIEQA